MGDVRHRQVYRAEPELDRWREVFERLDYADAWATRIQAGEPVDAASWAHAILGDEPGPAPVRALLKLRDAIVRQFGLETMTDKELPYTGFPLLEQSESGVLLGVDDEHLDFRVVVHVADGTVTLTTAVVLRNWFGRLYWTVVRLFHPFIARGGVRRARPELAGS